ncbi:hypothetical protein NKL07_22130 [Mesorhizobium sp. C280B]|uniref:hypothetical protein n=1 Tax=unclassified Mesorhizobium TaxID=325217 RepID=UPI0003FDB36B|nr:hypothetical protein [Mesorhizobium sp. LSJC280B00]
MAKIKTIWGPLTTLRGADRFAWLFSGVREDGSRAEWRLLFFFDSRRFTTRLVKRKDAVRTLQRMTEPDLFRLPEVARSETTEGRVTDLLRARLAPKHIAEATAAALKYGGAK